MIAYLLITSLLIPINIWAAITPHLHTVLTMRVLHAASVTVLVRCWHRSGSTAR